MAEISLSALRHNYRPLRSLLPPSTSILAVVKANAYGHGAVPVSRTLVEEGVRMLGVATVEEGGELRQAGVRCPFVGAGGREFTLGQLAVFSRGVAAMREAFGAGVAGEAVISAVIRSFREYAFDMV